jgi:hypothetical protein
MKNNSKNHQKMINSQKYEIPTPRENEEKIDPNSRKKESFRLKKAKISKTSKTGQKSIVS